MRKILIDDHKTELNEAGYGFPWEHDAICYNFRRPDEFVLNSELGGLTDFEDIETLVLGCDLDDYSFISKMKNLSQLYIYSGANVYDLDFVKGLFHLKQLYIIGSHISSLEPLKELLTEKQKRANSVRNTNGWFDFITEGIYIDSDNGELDGSMLAHEKVSEIIVNQRHIVR